MSRLSSTLADTFWDHVETTESGCQEWTRARTEGGYGVLTLDGVTTYAHRYSYEQANGPIPNGTELDHLCRNKPCVNPDHLEAVGHAENIRRGKRRTHCPHGHELTPENLVQNDGSRRCRTCRRDQRAARRKNRGSGHES